MLQGLTSVAGAEQTAQILDLTQSPVGYFSLIVFVLAYAW